MMSVGYCHAESYLQFCIGNLRKRFGSTVSGLHGKILVAHFLERRANPPATGREELVPYPRRVSVHPSQPLLDHAGVLRGVLPRDIIVDAFAVRTGFLAESNQSGIQFRIRMWIQQTPPPCGEIAIGAHLLANIFASSSGYVGAPLSA